MCSKARSRSSSGGISSLTLGRPVGHSRLSCPPLDVLSDAQHAAERVMGSALAPWQKLDALRCSVMPRLKHSLRLGPLHYGEEVWQRLRSAANTTPGPDGLRCVAWRALDPGARLLTLAFNLRKGHRRVPAQWGRSSTILIHKGGDSNDPSCCTIAKVYSGLWADRLSCWAEAEDLLSPGQKGFRHYDGVLEHNSIPQSALTAPRRRVGGELHVCFIDLTNAFGSLSHSYLWGVLARLGLELEMLLNLQSIYDDTTTVYTTAQGTSDPLSDLRY